MKKLHVILCVALTLMITAMPCATFASTGSTTSQGVEMSAMASKVSRPKITLKYVNDYSNIKISWKKCSGAQKYWVYRAENGGRYRRVKVTTATSFTDKDIQFNKKYTYKVKAIGKNGAKSSFSNIKSGLIEFDELTYDDSFGVPDFGFWFSVEPYDIYYSDYGVTYYYWGPDILDNGYDFDEILPMYEGFLFACGFDYLTDVYYDDFETISYHYARSYDNLGVVVSFSPEGVSVFVID